MVGRGLGVIAPMVGGILFFCWTMGLTIGDVPTGVWLGAAGFCAGVWMSYMALWLSQLASAADIYAGLVELQLDDMQKRSSGVVTNIK
jgi:hypothetical protein